MNFEVSDNSWTLKFNNFFEYQNVINDTPLSHSASAIMTHCIRKLMYYLPLTQIKFVKEVVLNGTRSENINNADTIKQ